MSSGVAQRLLDHRTFSGLEVERQAHDFERQQQIGKDDGRIDVQRFGGRDGDFGCELRASCRSR